MAEAAFPLNPEQGDIMTNITGTVDMRGYLDWLGAHGYGINLAIQ